MKKPQHIPIDQYDYPLDDDRIAKYPLPDRDRSKLLVYKDGNIMERTFTDAPALLQPGDRLFFNTTRVVQARLEFRKATGARIEIFILDPHAPADHQLAYGSYGPVEFVCLVGNAKKWKGEELTMDIRDFRVSAMLADRKDGKFIVRFSWTRPQASFGEVLEKAGSTPIPPYLKRKAEQKDASTYQTVYARMDGSVAAPTAGLHFTENVLKAIDDRGVSRHDLTLHVGAGTFIPVKEENAAEHRMHAELVQADRTLLESLLEEGRNIAVGTTTTRSLESLYWLGVRATNEKEFSFSNLYLDQWDAYGMKDGLSLPEALTALIEKMDRAGINSFNFRTRIMITPGYDFRVIDGLFTNFHQPRSTLLLLIAALTGDDWKKIYDFALEKDFRFLSYGDSSLLMR